MENLWKTLTNAGIIFQLFAAQGLGVPDTDEGFINEFELQDP